MSLLMRWVAFEALSVAQLYSLMSLRQRVFVVEQTCPYLDADGKDVGAWHGWGEVDGHLVATARLLAPGVAFAEPSIGRVVTAQQVRRSGVGRGLMHSALAELERLFPGQPVRIGAQRYLERFYGSLGFAVASAPYDEDGIPHIEMVRVSALRRSS